MTPSLIKEVQQYASFTEEEMQMAEGYFTPVDLKKGEHFLMEGTVCNKIAFVEKGAFLYYMQIDGEEKVCDFAFEGDWITHVKSMISQMPSEMNIRAIEPCRIMMIQAEKLERLVTEIPKINLIRVQLSEKYFVQSADHASRLANLNAEERYTKLMKEKPFLLQRVPQYYIASYLGIKPQSLSRIRMKKA